MLQVYNAQPNLTIINGEIKTTSLAVAEHFKKEHKHICEAIRNLDCSDKFRSANFSTDVFTDRNFAESVI